MKLFVDKWQIRVKFSCDYNPAIISTVLATIVEFLDIVSYYSSKVPLNYGNNSKNEVNNKNHDNVTAK